jgi:ribosome biogenesis GTPase
MSELEAYLEPGRTIALVGSSGVGKSSLVNRLLGEERLATAPVREDDDRGRHTTTERRIVRLPGRALLVDTPGLREVGLSGGVEGLGQAFEDIAEFAALCRFRDCRHETEPSCAVLDAVANGQLEADRLESFRKLLREAAHETRKTDPLARSEEMKKWKRVFREARRRSHER